MKQFLQSVTDVRCHCGSGERAGQIGRLFKIGEMARNGLCHVLDSETKKVMKEKSINWRSEYKTEREENYSKKYCEEREDYK